LIGSDLNINYSIFTVQLNCCLIGLITLKVHRITQGSKVSQGHGGGPYLNLPWEDEWEQCRTPSGT